MIKRIVLILLLFVTVGVAVWAAFRFVRPKWQGGSGSEPAVAEGPRVDTWEQAAEKVKADRGEPVGRGATVETPPELKHYSERYWFLATQVAEIDKYDVHIVQDYMDLAAMIERGEMVSVPWVTESYVLFGIGQRADDEPFLPDEDDRKVEIHDQSLQSLAKNFGGRSYDINNAADRQALKINMLSSLRPQALKVLEEVASAYHGQFDRQLPVSSLVRPEQYQRALRRVNRNATLIETPPHSTGLAFDIDYRYLSGAEQSFVMAELARLKREGRIEVIRERNANYHVFAFVNGARPSDELIAASLEEAGSPVQQQAHHATPSKQASAKSRKVTKKSTKSRRARSNVRQNRRRR